MDVVSWNYYQLASLNELEPKKESNAYSLDLKCPLNGTDMIITMVEEIWDKQIYTSQLCTSSLKKASNSDCSSAISQKMAESSADQLQVTDFVKDQSLVRLPHSLGRCVFPNS
ncbi:hypothetical protein TNCT_307871 [Trichonephila clavata]|uniref:Uncharacterized protein n=1 Tax=Trichonephila clavata TaxID=2740835 RepID=A0A8X6HPT0_TRICU|nr:hypothetical protein TNCT_307871 [Trichonephila clavata]